MVVEMIGTPPRFVRWLILTDEGYQRISAHRSRKPVLKPPAAGTVLRILERKLPVQLESLEKLFAAFGLTLEPTDYQSYLRDDEVSDPGPYRDLSDLFVGRKNELAEIRRRFVKDAVVVVAALGGSGKTRTARAYCDQYRAKYNHIFWVRAESAAEVREGYAAIADSLGLPGTELPEGLRAASAMEWLRKNAGWLLVLDNLDTPEVGTAYFPRNRKSHTLITSRMARLSFPNVGAAYVLPTLSPTDSVEFLLTRCGRQAASAGERKAAEEIAQELGHLPLALVQAATYIVNYKATFADYRDLYEIRKLEQLAKQGPFDEEMPIGVATTWEMNFRQIETEAGTTDTAGRYAADLLRFSAFLGPDDIPMNLIIEGDGIAEVCPGLHALLAAAGTDAIRREVYNIALEPLTRYSLVAKDPEKHTFSVHRLVQEVTRKRLPEEDRARWREGVVRAMELAFPAPNFGNWPLCKSLMTHATAVRDLILEEKIQTEQSGRLLEKMGRYLYDVAQYPLAERYYQDAAEIRRVALHPDHPDFIIACHNLARLLHDKREYGDALSRYEDAMRITRLHHAEVSEEVSMVLNGVGGVYDSQGDYQRAEQCYLQSHSISRARYGDEKEFPGYAAQNLGLLYFRQGLSERRARHSQSAKALFEKAEGRYREALTIFERCLPNDHPDRANTLHNLAQLCRAMDDPDRALPLYKQAIRIQTKAYGQKGHPLLSTSHFNIAELYESLEMYTEAARHYRAGRDIDVKLHGSDHPDVVIFEERLQSLALKGLKGFQS